MKKGLTRTLSLVLCFLMLGSFLSLSFSIKGEAAADGQRFIFSSLRSSLGALYSPQSDGTLLISPVQSGQSLTAVGLSTMSNNGKNNAIYISLINRSGATELSLTYSHLENNVPTTHRIEQGLLPNTEQEQSFVLLAPHISDHLTSLSLCFSGSDADDGTVTLLSFFDVSIYEGQGDGDATIVHCAYHAETGTVDVRGELSYAATVRYAGETLALFRLAPGEDLYLSPGKTPVAQMGVSFDFTFSVPVQSADQLYVRYVVAAVTKKGERVPLCAPLYPDIAFDQTDAEVGFKGYHTNSLYATLDSGAGSEIVDVYLDRLQNERNDGILYAGDRSYYYFDENYVSELDRRVRNLSGAGCTVYLRFLVSSDASGFPFVAYIEDDTGIVNKGIAIGDEEALLAVHAYTDFLTSRYRGGTQGKIDGIILGRRADCASKYGYVGSMALADYAELYAASLQLISGTARGNIPDLQMIVPVSDRTWSKTVSDEQLNGEYFTDLFIISLLEVLNCTMKTPLSLTLMLESDTTPARLSGAHPTTYGFDGVEQFLLTLEQYSIFYDFLDTDILYSWTPDEGLSYDQLRAAYAMQYIGLWQNEAVKCFFVDLSLPELQGNEGIARDLLHLVTYINTTDTQSVTDPLLETLGVDDLGELFDDYDPASLATRRVIRQELSEDGYDTSGEITGRYELWNFAATTSVLGWYAGNACNTLSVLGRALTAGFSATKNGEFAEIAYHFNDLKNYEQAPLLRFLLGVDGTNETPYEIQLRLIGENTTVISSAVIASGGEQELFLDLSQYAADLTEIRGVRLLARPLNASESDYRVQLRSVTVESTELDDQELALLMADGSATTDEDGGKNDYTTPILVSVLVFLASVAVVVFIVMKRRTRGQAKE